MKNKLVLNISNRKIWSGQDQDPSNIFPVSEEIHTLIRLIHKVTRTLKNSKLYIFTIVATFTLNI